MTTETEEYNEAEALEDDEAEAAPAPTAFDQLTHKLKPEAKLAMRDAIDKLNVPPDDVLLILMERMGIFLDLYEKIPEKIQAATAQAVEDAQIPIVKTKEQAIISFQVQIVESLAEITRLLEASTNENSQNIVDAISDIKEMTEKEYMSLRNGTKDLLKDLLTEQKTEIEKAYQQTISDLQKQHKKATRDILSRMSNRPWQKTAELMIQGALIAAAAFGGGLIAHKYPGLLQAFGL